VKEKKGKGIGYEKWKILIDNKIKE